MSTDDPNPSDLPPAVRETLDSLGGALGDIAELDKEQLNETIGLLETLGHNQAAGILRSRREVLKGAGAATGLGIAGLAGATATGGARAQSDTQTGTIGNGNQDADLQDVSAQSVSTDDAVVSNAPTSDNDVARRQEVVQTGTKLWTSSIAGASDDGWDTFSEVTRTVSYPEQFDSTPNVLADIQNANTSRDQQIRTTVDLVTSSQFDVTFYLYGTNSSSQQEIAWIATEGRP